MKDIQTVRNVIDETMHDLGAKNCRVTIYHEPRGPSYVVVKYVDPKNKDEVLIEKVYLKGSTLVDINGFQTDLLDPGSIEFLKATLGFQYDLYSQKRWKALALMPWALTKFLWRAKNVVKLEARHWLGGRFVKPPAYRSSQ